jgi:hypothetical protein
VTPPGVGRVAQHRGDRFEGLGKWALPALCLLIVGLLPLSTVAQTTEPLLPVPPPPSGPQAPAAPGQPIFPGQTVTQRPRPELDPIGPHVGDFFWFPQAEVDEAFNSNIFATSSSTANDFITVLQPKFDLLSSFPQDALNLHGGAALQYYAKNPTQNTENGFGAVDGRVNITAESWFYGNALAAHLNYPRTSPDSPGNAAQPVTYDSYTATAGYVQSGLLVGYQAEIAALAQRFNDVPLIGGGISPQSANDINIYEASLRANYELVPDYLGYIRFAEDLRIYPNTLPGGVSFNSLGYRADIGLQILPAGVAYGEIYAGYLSQDFRTSSLSPVSGLDAGGRLVWNVTRLTTATFNALRTVNTSNPTVGNTGTGYLASTVEVNLDHELLRDLLLNANAGYENDAFQGISRTDNVFSAGAGVKYLLNRNLYLGGSYSYQQRASSGIAAGVPYAQSIFLLRLSTQF